MWSQAIRSAKNHLPDIEGLARQAELGEMPNIHKENVQRLERCKWFKVYDVIERLDDYLGNLNYDSGVYEHFTTELNEFFIENGIGWKLLGGRIEIRGSESFEQVLTSAKETEHQHGHVTASKELQAIADLSRRPSPDPTGRYSMLWLRWSASRGRLLATNKRPSGR